MLYQGTADSVFCQAKISCIGENLEAVPIGDGMQIGKKNFCLARKKLAGILTDFKSF